MDLHFISLLTQFTDDTHKFVHSVVLHLFGLTERVCLHANNRLYTMSTASPYNLEVHLIHFRGTLKEF